MKTLDSLEKMALIYANKFVQLDDRSPRVCTTAQHEIMKEAMKAAYEDGYDDAIRSNGETGWEEGSA